MVPLYNVNYINASSASTLKNAENSPKACVVINGWICKDRGVTVSWKHVTKVTNTF